MTKSKVAFCFPGQGSLELGMGRDIAEAVPEAMRVFELGSAASGLDLDAAVLRRRPRGARRDRRSAAGARGHEPRRAGRAPGPRHRARLRRRALGRRVRRAGGCVVDRRRGDDRPRPGARARHGRGRAGAPGANGRHPRARRRRRRANLQAHPRCVAGQLQLPRAACCLGRERRCRRVLRPGRGGWSAAHGEAARLGCVPLPAGCARGGASSAGGGQGALRRAGGALHVHGDGSGRVGAAHRSAARRPADRRPFASRRPQPSSYATALARSWRSGRATSCRGSSSASTRA